MTWSGPVFGASAALAIASAIAAAFLARPRDAVLALSLCLLGTAGACLALGSGFVFILVGAGLVIPVPAALLAAVLLAPPAEPDQRTGARAVLAPAAGLALFLVLSLLLVRVWPAGGGVPQTAPEWLGSRALTDDVLAFLLTAAALSLSGLGAVALLRPRQSAR